MNRVQNRLKQQLFLQNTALLAAFASEIAKRRQKISYVIGVRGGLSFFICETNPIKLKDPDGRDIHNIGIIGAGVKLVVGGGANFGIAWDDNGHIAVFSSLHVGIGVEAGVDTPISPSYSVTKGQNISDLPSIGPYHFATGTDASAGAGVGIIFDMDSKEIVGGAIGTIGGSVNKSLTIYTDLAELGRLSDIPADANKLLQDFAETNKDILPQNVYGAIMKLPVQEAEY
jgi:hypothetical protein